MPAPLVPVGAVVQKRCTCGRPAGHQGHPRYRVVGLHPNPRVPADWDWCGTAHLERLDTGRRHRTSMLVLRDQYVIVSLPVEAVLL